VSPISSETVILYFLMLCRIGGCLMFMPGFSSPRVPQQVRMFIAISGTLALAPILLPTVSAAVAKTQGTPVLLMLSEVTIGALIGIMGRFFYLALEFMATAVASCMGFSNLPGTPIEHTDPIPAIGAFITLTATALFFIMDQHWEVMRGLVASYTAMPIDRAFAADFSLAQLSDAMTDAFVLTLQISSPFIVYAISVNFLFGVAAKLTPQIAIYFVSTPFVMAGGLLLLYFIVSDFMRLFMAGFMKWLTNG
jgi:flagellar biosynthesis protein FliR